MKLVTRNLNLVSSFTIMFRGALPTNWREIQSKESRLILKKSKSKLRLRIRRRIQRPKKAKRRSPSKVERLTIDRLDSKPHRKRRDLFLRGRMRLSNLEGTSRGMVTSLPKIGSSMSRDILKRGDRWTTIPVIENSKGLTMICTTKDPWIQGFTQ